jgi:hypothetical protein
VISGTVAICRFLSSGGLRAEAVGELSEGLPTAFLYVLILS